MLLRSGFGCLGEQFGGHPFGKAGRFAGVLPVVRHLPNNASSNDRALEEDIELLREIGRIVIPFLFAQVADISDDLLFVFRGEAARRGLCDRELRRGIDEHASAELGPRKPVLVKVEDGEDPLSGCLGLGFNELHELVAEDLVATAHRGEDELVLGFEVVIEGHAADPALFQDVVQTRGVKPVSIEDTHRGVDQFVSSAWGQSGSPMSVSA